MLLTDHAVVKTICEGGPDAPAAIEHLLFTLCHDAVTYWSRRGKGQIEYDELMQELYLHLSGPNGDWPALRAWQAKSRLQTYLSSIISRLFIDRMRPVLRERQRLSMAQAVEFHELPDEKESHSENERWELEFKMSRIMGVLYKLSETEQLVILMSLDGFPQAEIAFAAGISIGNMRVIKTRAINKLREALMGGNDDTRPD